LSRGEEQKRIAEVIFRRVVALAALAGALVLTESRAALADPPAGASGESAERRAARAFADAQTAFEAKDYKRAASLFETAYAAKPHHAALWNAARSWHHAGEDVLCAEALDRYLKEAPADAPNREDATTTLGDVMKRVGRVQVRVVAVTHVQLDGNAKSADSEGPYYVLPGDHVLTAEEADGTQVKKPFTIGRGETLKIMLTAGKKNEPPTPPVKEVPETKSSGSRFMSPWVVVGGGVLVAAGAFVTVLSGLDTLNKRNAFIADQTQAKLEDGFASQTRTNVALGVTAGVAVLTAVLAAFFVDWSGSSSHQHRAERAP
jgi:hypothetical protein